MFQECHVQLLPRKELYSFPSPGPNRWFLATVREMTHPNELDLESDPYHPFLNDSLHFSESFHVCLFHIGL
jgi:hypothetical protein